MKAQLWSVGLAVAFVLPSGCVRGVPAGNEPGSVAETMSPEMSRLCADSASVASGGATCVLQDQGLHPYAMPASSPDFGTRPTRSR